MSRRLLRPLLIALATLPLASAVARADFLYVDSPLTVADQLPNARGYGDVAIMADNGNPGLHSPQVRWAGSCSTSA